MTNNDVIDFIIRHPNAEVSFKMDLSDPCGRFILSVFDSVEKLKYECSFDISCTEDLEMIIHDILGDAVLNLYEEETQ